MRWCSAVERLEKILRRGNYAKRQSPGAANVARDNKKKARIIPRHLQLGTPKFLVRFVLPFTVLGDCHKRNEPKCNEKFVNWYMAVHKPCAMLSTNVPTQHFCRRTAHRRTNLSNYLAQERSVFVFYFIHAMWIQQLLGWAGSSVSGRGLRGILGVR